jgi:26S proteasome regulatory subunit N2
VERMFRKCYEDDDYKPAIGIAIESRRLDVVEDGIKQASMRGKERIRKTNDSSDAKDPSVDLMEYVLDTAMGEVLEISLRERVCFSSLVTT